MILYFKFFSPEVTFFRNQKFRSGETFSIKIHFAFIFRNNAYAGFQPDIQFTKKI